MNKPTFDAMAAQYALEEAKGEGSVQWKDGAHCVVPSVVIGGKAVQDGTPAPENPIMPVFSEGTTIRATNADGFDGGTAVAPELLAAPDGSKMSTWDPQTGKGLNWWWDEIVLDGSDFWTTYISYKGFSCRGAKLPEAMTRNAFWSNQGIFLKGASAATNQTIWCGVNNRIIYCTFNPFFDETLEDYGLANWKAYLHEKPLRLWVSRNEPIEFQTDPQPLVQPKGDCNLIQTGGTLEDCPITAKYVTHS